MLEALQPRPSLLAAAAAVVTAMTAVSARGGEWAVDHPLPGVFVLRNEAGAWGGFSMGVAHQNQPKYQVRKTLDLSALPPGAAARAKAARLRLYFAIQDYSWNVGDRTHNGLNESFEIVVNGKPMHFETADPRFPARAGPQDRLYADWVDLDLPRDTLNTDTLEVVIRKCPGGRDDDYIYPGIDNSVPTTHSAVSFDGGETWEADKLNAIDATGEYMIRLVLSEADLAAMARWTLPEGLNDPEGLVAYRGRDGDSWRLEPRPGSFDPSRPLAATVVFRGPPPAATWLDAAGQELPEGLPGLSERVALTTTLPPGQWNVGALVVTPKPDTAVERIEVAFEKPTTPSRPVVDLCPAVAQPRGERRSVPPSCKLTAETAELDNGSLRATFRTRPSLALTSLHAAEIDRNVLARPEQTHLFRIKVGDAVYGCHDCRTLGLAPVGNGFACTLALADTGLQAVFRTSIDQNELRLGLEVVNAGEGTTRFHLAFPHLGGIELTPDAENDHYLFPWGGGVIADARASLRTSYGENTAWWQMIDLFAPSRGGGLYLRADDPTGLYKCPALRKGEAVHTDFILEETGRGYLAPDMLCPTSLEPDPGIAVTFDYLRRERPPGGSFAAPDACIGSHAGDWRNAMRAYVEWSHRTWPPRPRPSKLTDRWHVVAPGWGQSPLFRDGAYRADYLKPRHDVAEMMSWWTWSDAGPWGTPMDQLKAELGEALYKRYNAYWVTEPATGKLMYPLNRGDYDGYMPQWGGLAALQAHIRRVRQAGILPMFYTDPILACANTKLGSRYGPTYGVMNPLWKDTYNSGKTPAGYAGSYGSYNMCLDTEWYSNWVAEAMGRVCRETGIDGVRLDEYGHRGYVCHSDRHEHIFAEPGHNAWLQALARNCRQVHAAMDAVRPELVLTTEFPGNDHMAAALEGAIVYDVRRIRPLRPAPINLFRFFFPQCKAFEIDRPARREARAWMLWNAVGAFQALYNEAQHALLKENTDAFEGQNAEPLVPTLIPRVYANRFEANGKRIFCLHNATGHTVEGPVLAVEAGPGHHILDLLKGTELTPAPDEGRPAIALRMPRDTTRVIARLPRLLRTNGGTVSIPAGSEGTVIRVADPNGRSLADLKPDVPLREQRFDGKPHLIKLLRRGRLADAVPWPHDG